MFLLSLIAQIKFPELLRLLASFNEIFVFEFLIRETCFSSVRVSNELDI